MDLLIKQKIPVILQHHAEEERVIYKKKLTGGGADLSGEIFTCILHKLNKI